MRRLRRWISAVVMGLALALGGAAVLGLSGCDMIEGSETPVAPGQPSSPSHGKHALAYVGLLLLGTFFFWTVVKSSRRSIVKAGEEH